MKGISALGIMSGTSLDGLDLAHCEFVPGDAWSFKITHAETIPYTSEWTQRLGQAMQLSGEALVKADREYGALIGHAAADFIKKHDLCPDFIASHGHTVFHRPEEGYTLQIGHGAAIAAATGFPVICDFRSKDVALGGQGAPLVPIGDRMLFPAYGACINLGGFANISLEKDGARIAWDIAAVNTVLNHFSKKLDQPYDDGGRTAKSGTACKKLLEQLRQLEFYAAAPPKSLGMEWVNAHVLPLLENQELAVADLLATYCMHAAEVIGATIREYRPERVLLTGGGVYNAFLIEQIREQCEAQLDIPGDTIIQFKEAMIFAFLGALRWQQQVNTLKSVTGARADSSGGTIFI